MRRHTKLLRMTTILVACTVLVGTNDVPAHAAPPPEITTPDKVDTRIGVLNFKDGVPSKETVEKIYDNLDFTHAFEAFVNTFQGVSIAALHKGFQSAGVKDNEVLIFSDLMDARSLFLTANADTIYSLGMLDLSKGPMVLEVGPKMLGAVDDQWFRWVIDLGSPGADRGEGGKYLILPPGYEGNVPEGGYFVARSRTNFVIWFARAFMENSDPKPVVEQIKKTLKVYPYQAGGYGTPVAEFLAGKTSLGPITPPPPTVFHEGTGKVMNTIPPNDYSYYEWLDKIVQQEPATALDAELMGPIGAIGIVKGKSFAPDARMKKILTEAVALANATSRTLFMAPRAADWYYYPGSGWVNQLFVSGYEFETPIPEITPDGVKPFPPTGYRLLDSRTSFFYGVTGITPGMAMRVPGIGSQYLWTTVDADKQPFDGAKTYRVTLPKDIPYANFWSFIVYDNQTRSMLDTPQRYPRAGSQSYPSPAAEAAADGTTTVWFSPTQPEGVKRGNWIQTMPGKGFLPCLRLYGPRESFFTKEWRPSEVELVR